METAFRREAEDIGNIVALEHVNVQAPDQRVASAFYIDGLGLTRDPYMQVTDANIWINAGRNQFHLPGRQAQAVRGTIGLVTPFIDTIRRRLPRLEEKLAGTRFECVDEGDTLLATCPWGNRIRVHPCGEFGQMQLGIPYVRLDVAPGTAEGIARFYDEVMGAGAEVLAGATGAETHVRVGPSQELIFAETNAPIAEYDGHHIAIYVSQFSKPHGWLADRGLVTEESDPYQFRFASIAEPSTGTELFKLEHEVRSLTHPMFARQYRLANRNPEQRMATGYVPGHDAFAPL
jgi:hypothetical protein